MSQIKVRAGQVWEFKSGAPNYKNGDRLRIMDLDRGGRFHDAKPMNIEDPAGIHSVTPGFLNAFFAFIPQGKVEWMAVNLDEWYCASDYLRNGSGSPFTCTEVHHDAVHINEWQNMRYYLGLDKKPHYKLIDGEWVKR